MKLDEQLVEDLYRQIDGKRSFQDLQIFHGIMKKLNTKDETTKELLFKFKDGIVNPLIESGFFYTNSYILSRYVPSMYVVINGIKLINLRSSRGYIYPTKRTALLALTTFLNNKLGSTETKEIRQYDYVKRRWINTPTEEVNYSFSDDSSSEEIHAMIRAKNVFKTGKGLQNYLLERKIVEIMTTDDYNDIISQLHK